MKMSDEKKGFFSRFMKKKESECGCSCCGGIRIVSKEKTAEEETDSESRDLTDAKGF